VALQVTRPKTSDDGFCILAFNGQADMPMRRAATCSASFALAIVASPANAVMKSNDAALGFFVALCLLLSALFYIIPGLIAWDRGLHDQRRIWLLTIFLGWTGIGWLIALILALKRSQKSSSG
jgi:hypothetical protein